MRKPRRVRAPKKLLPYLQDMLGELEEGCLDVVLVPSRVYQEAIRGAMIRVAQSQNAPWYRKLCLKFSSSRVRRNNLHDTRLKRRNVLTTMRVLVAGKRSPSYLVPHLLREASIREEYDRPPF